MKKLITTAVLLFNLTIFAQNRVPQSEKIEIYTYKNSIREVTPLIVVENNKVYTTEDGVKNVIPVLVIEDNKVYIVNPNTAVREITPIIEIKQDVTLPQ